MFSFGDSEANAAVFLEMACAESGVAIDSPLDEQGAQELASSLTIARIAVKLALRAGATPECVDILLDWHDEAFKALLEGSERFRSRVLKRQYPDLRNDRSFYVALAEAASD